MKRILREPLFHFLLGGAALFFVYAWVAVPGPERPDRIVVSESRVVMLARSFERIWMRPPSATELRGLIDDYVTEEAIYREALALGLDRDDLVVRRRMRQKMEFLNAGLADSEPTEEDLRAFLAGNPERFRAPSRISFAQVFLDPRADRPVEERAADLLTRLRAGEDGGAAGDPTLLPRELAASTLAEVANIFGPAFAEALAEAPEEEWNGPLASSFGAHLVRVSAHEPDRLPPLEEARAAVEREWAAEQQATALERFEGTLRERYEVEVRMPSGTATPELAGRP